MESKPEYKTKNNRNKVTSLVSEIGKVMPNATELEEVVLGSIIIEKDAIEKVDLVVDDFYSEKNKVIYQAILNLKNKRSVIDMFTVSEELQLMGEIDNIGGSYFIVMLTSRVTSAANLQYHSLIIKQKSISRNLIKLSSEIQTMAYDQNTDVADIIEYLEKNYTEIITGSIQSDASDIEVSLTETIKYIENIQYNAQNGLSTAITTGLKGLDRQLNGGWKAPDLIVLGGRPSMGKTQFAVHFAKHSSTNSNSTLFVSIEMTKIQLVIRMITEHDGIDFYKLKTGQLSNEEWGFIESRIEEISKMKLFIADDYNIRYLNNIKSLARKYSRKSDLKLLIIDYLQLIKTNTRFSTRDLEIGFITGELKNLAKELNIPIILLAQLNRPMKGIKVSSPKLEDLRESGNIEQDADIVIFPHRPSYYDEDALDENQVSWKNRGGLIIAKHREGERDVKVLFQHDKSFKKIFDDGYIQETSVEYMEANVNFYETDKKEIETPF